MSLNCSLYCLINAPKLILDKVKEIVHPNQLEVVGDDNNWQAFRYQSECLTLIVDRIVITETSNEKIDSFLNLRLNTQSFVNAISTQATNVQSDLSEHISKVTQILVFELECESDDSFDEESEEILFELAKEFKGVIFTGNDFLNNEGGLILDVSGESHEEVIA